MTEQLTLNIEERRRQFFFTAEIAEDAEESKNIQNKNRCKTLILNIFLIFSLRSLR